MRYYLNKTLQLQKEEFLFNEELNGGIMPHIIEILMYDYMHLQMSLSLRNDCSTVHEKSILNNTFLSFI
jgi:hypothetical protein